KDVNGNAISGIAGSLTLDVKDSSNATPAAGKVTVGSLTETGTPGVYTAKLKGMLADTYTVKPLLSGSAVGSLSDTVTLTAGTTPDGSQSTFTATPKSVAADNTATSTLILTVKDTFGNAITGIAGNRC
ncbi:invasin, partial [Atlantibacter hermannii]